jgi:hypothetical protein
MDAVTDVDEVRDADGLIPIKDFSEMRDKCPALREVLLPDSIWQQFRDWHSRPDDVAAHCSIVLLAFRRGYLGRVTAPIHRYIVSSAGVLPGVRKQYVKDLRERWMLHGDPIKRNRLARIFRGRLVELQFAVWLESQSHKVVGLETTREGPDIETVSSDGIANTFEVKFIGVEDADFTSFLQSIAGLQAGGSVSPYTAMNYLLFRAYEAARQLRAVTGTKTVVVVIDDTTWCRFAMQLTGHWINWANPQFFSGEFVSQEDDWNAFFTEQRKHHPYLPNDLAPALQEIHSVKIFRQTSAFEFCLEYDQSLRHHFDPDIRHIQAP